MERNLAIYDSDVVYATRLMEFFKRTKDFAFEVSVFTRKDCLEDYVKNKKIDLLLLDDNISQEEVKHENIKLIYLLSDKKSVKQDLSIPSIFKYQSAQTIMSEIISYYASEEREVGVGSLLNHTKLFTIFSPILSANKYAFAWSFASILAEKKKTLLINLELFPNMPVSLCDAADQGLSEFIYYLKQDNPNIIMKMKSLLRYTGKLAFMPGVTHGFDLLSLNKEEISKWMEELKSFKEYEIVIFYLGFYSEAAMEVLSKSSYICLPTTDNFYEDAVLREWERQTNLTGLEVKQEKFQRISIPREEGLGKKNFSIQELKGSSIWSCAEQYIGKYKLGD